MSVRGQDRGNPPGWRLPSVLSPVRGPSSPNGESHHVGPSHNDLLHGHLLNASKPNVAINSYRVKRHIGLLFTDRNSVEFGLVCSANRTAPGISNPRSPSVRRVRSNPLVPRSGTRNRGLWGRARSPSRCPFQTGRLFALRVCQRQSETQFKTRRGRSHLAERLQTHLSHQNQGGEPPDRSRRGRREHEGCAEQKEALRPPGPPRPDRSHRGWPAPGAERRARVQEGVSGCHPARRVGVVERPQSGNAKVSTGYCSDRTLSRSVTATKGGRATRSSGPDRAAWRFAGMDGSRQASRAQPAKDAALPSTSAR